MTFKERVRNLVGLNEANNPGDKVDYKAMESEENELDRFMRSIEPDNSVDDGDKVVRRSSSAPEKLTIKQRDIPMIKLVTRKIDSAPKSLKVISFGKSGATEEERKEFEILSKKAQKKGIQVIY